MTQGKIFQMGTFRRPCCPQHQYRLPSPFPPLLLKEKTLAWQQPLDVSQIRCPKRGPLWALLVLFAQLVLKDLERRGSHKPCHASLLIWLILHAVIFAYYCYLHAPWTKSSFFLHSSIFYTGNHWSYSLLVFLSVDWSMVCQVFPDGLDFPDWSLWAWHWPWSLVHVHCAAFHWALWAFLHFIMSRSS